MLRMDYSPSKSSHNKPRENTNSSISTSFALTSNCSGLCLVFEDLIEIVIYSLPLSKDIIRCSKTSSKCRNCLRVYQRTTEDES